MLPCSAFTQITKSEEQLSFVYASGRAHHTVQSSRTCLGTIRDGETDRHVQGRRQLGGGWSGLSRVPFRWCRYVRMDKSCHNFELKSDWKELLRHFHLWRVLPIHYNHSRSCINFTDLLFYSPHIPMCQEISLRAHSAHFFFFKIFWHPRMASRLCSVPALAHLVLQESKLRLLYGWAWLLADLLILPFFRLITDPRYDSYPCINDQSKIGGALHGDRQPTCCRERIDYMGWTNSVHAECRPRRALADIRASWHDIFDWCVLFSCPRSTQGKDWDDIVAKRTFDISTYTYFPPYSASSNMQVTEDEAVDILARQYGVLLMPGSPFGAPQFMRLSYGSLPPDAAVSAVERLSEGFNQLRVLSSSR